VTSGMVPAREDAPIMPVGSPGVVRTFRDLAGAETLGIMQSAPRYNEWQYDRISPYLGRRICEVGAGIGNMSVLIDRHRPELLLLTDTDPHYRDILGKTFSGRDHVRVEDLTFPCDEAAERFRGCELDTVVALNVLEHISDDLATMRSIQRMLVPGGRAIILVPALMGLYGSLDRELGHARRYGRRELATLMTQAGLRVERVFYFNLLGALGWFLNARLFRAPRIPLRQLRSFDAMVPALRFEDMMPLPVGQSLIAIGSRSA
jgi:SAM-dependent methyltransferase